MASNYTQEDLRPVLGMQLKPSQVAQMENVHLRTIHRWVKLGYFDPYYILGDNQVRIPIEAYLKWRQSRRVTKGNES